MILVLSQRDIRHPAAGGAEHYTHLALKRLAKQYSVVHIAVGHDSLPEQETIDGITYIRMGKNLLELTVKGIIYYFRHRSAIKLVIDHSNTHQFLSFLWAKSKRILFIHQLTQEIWSYFFGSILGPILRLGEEVLLRLSRGTAITVSESTKKDLTDRGFKQVFICPEGNSPKKTVLPELNKKDYWVYVGRLVPYKRVEDAIQCAAHLGKKLRIIGRGPAAYERKLRNLAHNLGANCEFMGYLPQAEKDRVIELAELLVMPSIREGWGLVITESANLGTPSLVYDAPGTIEAVNHGKAGFVSEQISWEGLVATYQQISQEKYQQVREAAFRFSLELSWDKTAEEFSWIVNSVLKQKRKLERDDETWINA